MATDPERRRQWQRQYYTVNREKRRAQTRAAQAVYREKHYWEIQLARRLGISMKSARELFRQQQRED